MAKAYENFFNLKLKREYKTVFDITWRGEIDKDYPGYPSSVAHALMRGGIRTIGEARSLLESNPERIIGIRNLGPKKLEVLKELVNKYENEAIEKQYKEFTR